MIPKLLPLLVLVVLVSASSLLAKPAGADELWNQIIVMDAGPTNVPSTREEAARFALDHLTAQKAALDQFVKNYPSDPRTFDARIKAIRIHASIGSLRGDKRAAEQAFRAYSTLERSRGITREQAADAGFGRVSMLFMSARGQEDRMRENVVGAATNFHSRYPGDPRGPRLLVEAATICDSTPSIKRDLLETALRDTREEGLKERIMDDLRRLDRLGRKGDLKFKTLNGGTFNLADHRGKVVALVFWASDSPHSLIWMQQFAERIKPAAASGCVVATVSLDRDREGLMQSMKDLGINYPTGFDGEGWQNAVAKTCGINAVPTVWVYDKRGHLRVLNARDNYLSVINQLAKE